MMLDHHTVAVLGLGLIGGSIARDLAARGVYVVGYDAHDATLDAACNEGVVRERLDPSLSGLDKATIVVVAVPISAMRDVLTVASTHLAGALLVTDVGSTKISVVAVAESLGIASQFVGSHPMTGDHRSGLSAARTRLFERAAVYLCPAKSTTGDALALADELWRALGARPELIDAVVHDRRVAFTSHLPHAASAAIALTLSRAKVSLGDLGPGGRDVLRIAASSPEMWTEIAMDNSEPMMRALSDLVTELDRFQSALAARDASALYELFSAARNWTSEIIPDGATISTD